MQFSVHDVSGQVTRNIEIDDYIFATSFNEPVVHQAMVRQLANARVGSADTLTRGMVSGTTKKPFRQKHTGMARRGSNKSPLLRGGGIVFGPHPRSYRQSMPKKMRRLALRCVLSEKLSSGDVVVVEQLELATPKTIEMAKVLKALRVDSSALVVTSETNLNVVRAARNLPKIGTLPAALLNVVDLLSHKSLVITVDGLRKAEGIWGSGKAMQEVG